MFVLIINYGQESVTKISNVLTVLQVSHLILDYNILPNQPFTHIILSGGPKHVYEADHYPLADWIIYCKQPVLAICYGMQLVAHTFGGTVIRMKELEYGLVLVNNKLRCMNRYDQVIDSPFEVTEWTNKGHIAAFTDHEKFWAVQYHPESYKYRDYSIFINFFEKVIKKYES